MTRTTQILEIIRMVYYFNRQLSSNGNKVVNVHFFMNVTAMFTYSIGSFFNFLFNLPPVCSVCFGTITASPMRMIFTVQPKFRPPHSRTFMATKMVFSGCFKITNGSLKFLAAVCTPLTNSILRTSASCGTFVIALSGAIFSMISLERYKFGIANNAMYGFFTKMVLNSHNAKIHRIIEIDKDYYDGAVKRFETYKLQLKIF